MKLLNRVSLNFNFAHISQRQSCNGNDQNCVPDCLHVWWFLTIIKQDNGFDIPQ